MTWVSLKMISLGSMLLLNQRTSSSSPSAGAAGGCMSERRLKNLADRFQRRYWDKVGATRKLPPPLDVVACAQAAEEMSGDLNNRSVSPWRYRLNQDPDRFPQEIAFAECLCQGCIINQHEDLNYNSVSVFAPLMVLKKTRCPHDPNKYVVKRDLIKVPVACTCVVPKYAE